MISISLLVVSCCQNLLDINNVPDNVVQDYVYIPAFEIKLVKVAFFGLKTPNIEI